MFFFNGTHNFKLASYEGRQGQLRMNFQLGIWNGSSYDRAAKFKKKLNSRPQTVIILALTLVKISSKIQASTK